MRSLWECERMIRTSVRLLVDSQLTMEQEDIWAHIRGRDRQMVADEVSGCITAGPVDRRPARQNGSLYRRCTRVSSTVYIKAEPADIVLRPTVAGISGNAIDGAYSVALSGGYPDE